MLAIIRQYGRDIVVIPVENGETAEKECEDAAADAIRSEKMEGGYFDIYLYENADAACADEAYEFPYDHIIGIA
jgi:hypothetical protein